MRIIFVCLGNINRSYCAEVLAREMNMKHLFNSAGVAKNCGKARTKKIRTALYNITGKKIEQSKSKKFTKEMLSHYDIIYYMSDAIGRNLGKQFGFCSKFKKFADYDIPDPQGKDITFYNLVCGMIHNRLEQLYGKI